MSDTPPQTSSTSTPSEDIASKIKASINASFTNGQISDQVVAVFVTRENDRRTKLLVEGLDKLTALEKAYTALNKPDSAETFADAEGQQPNPKVYTAKRIQELKGDAKKIKRLSDALNVALTKASFDDLEKALKGGDKPGTDSE